MSLKFIFEKKKILDLHCYPRKKNSKILFDFLFYNELVVLLSIELRNLLLSMSQFTISKVKYEIGWKFRES